MLDVLIGLENITILVDACYVRDVNLERKYYLTAGRS